MKREPLKFKTKITSVGYSSVPESILLPGLSPNSGVIPPPFHGISL